MNIFLNPDNSAFCTALNSKIYIDKSEIIQYTNSVLESTDAYICNSRPRRFGKSITADMLTAYYSKGCDSREMFSDLKISKSADFSKYLNQYDVIHFDVQWCMEPAGGPEYVIDFIVKSVLQELRNAYVDMIPENVESLPEALSIINAVTKQRFVIIIDEWDVLFRDEVSEKVQEEYISFMRGMFKGNLPSRYIALAYLTGILPIKKIKTQSALNNFDEFTMLSASNFAPYVGFTEEEVISLCRKYNRDFAEVKRWYNGYRLEEYQIYNPKAVVSIITKGKFKSYWSETGTYDAIVPLINMDFDGLKGSIIEMISGAEVKVDVSSFQNDAMHFQNKDDVITYLIHLGYLGYNQNEQTAYIPNEEIRQELIAATRRKKWDDMIRFQNESKQFLNHVLNHEETEVAKLIEKIHMDYASTIKYNDENSLSSVITIALLSSMNYYSKPIRELPTGKGFADFVYLPKPELKDEYPALLVELKWNKDAETAIQQIKDKKYPESLLQYTGDILLVAVNYDKKEKEHQCIIEKM